jgi:hypothetical protein
MVTVDVMIRSLSRELWVPAIRRPCRLVALGRQDFGVVEQPPTHQLHQQLHQQFYQIPHSTKYVPPYLSALCERSDHYISCHVNRRIALGLN